MIIEDILVFLIGAFILFTAIILPWKNHYRIKKIIKLTNKSNNIVNKIPYVDDQDYSNDIKATDKEKYLSKTEDKVNISANSKLVYLNKEIVTPSFAELPKKNKVNDKSKRPFDFEKQFMAKLPVWVGGVALSLAGLFMVKYSIDNNLLSYNLRVILSSLFGIVLLFFGDRIRYKSGFANGVRIAQSLSGAGIVVLYASLLAATTLYNIIPNIIGLIGMAAVSLIAIMLSIKHGQPIAILALVGGFLTPALIGFKQPDNFIIYIYLYLIFIGLINIIKIKSWWWISLPALLSSFLWVLVEIINGFNSMSSIWLGVFLIAISLTTIVYSNNKYNKEVVNHKSITTTLNFINLIVTSILIGVIISFNEFRLMNFGLFIILTLVIVFLAHYDSKRYGFAPWVSMLVNLIVLINWHNPEQAVFITILLLFSFIFIFLSYYLIWYGKQPILWAGLTGISSVFYFLLAYFKLEYMNLINLPPLFWGGLATLFASGAVYTFIKSYRSFTNYKYKEYLLSVCIIVATTFVSIGFIIELKQEVLPTILAVEILIIVWLSNRVVNLIFRPIIIILLIVFFVFLIPEIILKNIDYIPFISNIYIPKSILLTITQLVFQLGLPAASFLIGAYILRLEGDDNLVKFLELVAAVFIIMMTYFLIHHIFYVSNSYFKIGLFERGIITNILFVLGVSFLIVGYKFIRSIFSQIGLVLFVIAILRIISFDLFSYNPLLVSQKIIGWPVLNSLILPFGLPILWINLINKQLLLINKENWINITNKFSLLLLFILISLNIRYFFHGEYLYQGITSNAEIYSYSVVWLLLSTFLLINGVIRQSKLLRYASLIITTITIFKVFLYDTSGLEGLYRVFSFLILGLSLIILSWFYSKFILVKK